MKKSELKEVIKEILQEDSLKKGDKVSYEYLPKEIEEILGKNEGVITGMIKGMYVVEFPIKWKDLLEKYPDFKTPTSSKEGYIYDEKNNKVTNPQTKYSWSGNQNYKTRNIPSKFKLV